MILCVFSEKNGKYVLKFNPNAKADIWKKFPLVWKVSADGVESEAKYYTACCKCLKVYQYKDSEGRNFGTKNLLDHKQRCLGSPKTNTQLELRQCFRNKPQLSQQDKDHLKRKQTEYCIEGYHSFKSIEHEGLLNLLQTTVDLGAKYGKFDVSDVLVKRKTISREADLLAVTVKAQLTERLKTCTYDGTVSLCIDMYTDDYRKQSYLDVHASWVDRDFSTHHAALAVHHFGSGAHTGENISIAVDEILSQYGLPVNDTPVTTDHGSNIVAALKNSVRLDCLCHRLHTVLETAWRDTRHNEPDASAYESAISELCRFVKQSTGLQEQLPMSLKHGGNTRPWVSLFRRAESVEKSYEALVTVLEGKERLDLIASVNRSLNRDMIEITRSVKEIFESLEKVEEPTLQLVAPSYYLLMKKFTPTVRESRVMNTFKKNLQKYMDDKFWTSIKALHWMATFLDPTFKLLEFIPMTTADDIGFRRDLLNDLDSWMLEEMKVVEEKLKARCTNVDEEARFDLKTFCYLLF